MAGALHLFKKEQQRIAKDQISHPFYIPISIIVPAYNEQVTIVESIRSLLKVDYRLYEIIIVNDGSLDDTEKVLLEAFPLKKVGRPVHKKVPCKEHLDIYETKINNIHITLVSKENGGKGDCLNMGINVSRFPYFLCIDADSLLQKDSLEKIVKPIFEDESIIAVGGLIRISQCAEIKEGEIQNHKIPGNPILGMQVVEYSRTFLASRILNNMYSGNLIISGAFGLFKKDIVIAVGGYDSLTLGEDMELVLKMHVFCRNHLKKYKIVYEPDAVCWTQAPTSLKDLAKQRRRWYLGLFQCMTKYYYIFANLRFGFVSFISYFYYLFFELLAPFIEILGILTIGMAFILGLLNYDFLIKLFILYSAFSVILTTTIFFQIVYVEYIKVSFTDRLKVIAICILESLFFRHVLSFVRMTSFIGYKKKKYAWGTIQRMEHMN